jgi:ATP-dependent DNA ligase
MGKSAGGDCGQIAAGCTINSTMHRRNCLALLALAAFPALPALAADAPALLLAQVYRPGLPLADYWVSEKYDGVRGFWDGHTLRTRGGETVPAPLVHRRLARGANGRRTVGRAWALQPRPVRRAPATAR